MHDPAGAFVRDTQMQWYFQDLQFSSMDEDAPQWKRDLAEETVDDVLAAAYDELKSIVRDAIESFEPNPKRMDEALRYLDQKL